jgi:hypothetical protein
MKRLIGTTLALWAAITPVRAADLLVVARGLVTGPDSHVELTNTSAQPATAWTLVVTTMEKNGRTRRAVETIDAYLSEVTRDFPGMSSKVDRLMPGQTRQVMLDPAPDGAVAEVTAVIFEDGTSAGDRETIASIFEHRIRERDQLREVVQVFDAVLPSTRGIAALEELKRRFSAPAAPSDESTAHRAAREAIDAYLQRTTAANADAVDQLVRKYADVVRREYDLAERHSHAKP